MKRGATKEEIIRATQELISRNGIRAVRVDEIAQTLGISKRTLYEMFADKTDLVQACLVEMGRLRQQRLSATNRRRSGNSLQKAYAMVHEYVDDLLDVESCFLADIRQKLTFAEHYDEYRTFWHAQLSELLERSKQEGFLLPEIHAQLFADRIMTTLYELRMNQASDEELYLFCRTLLRGSATQQGIEWIDSH